MTVMSQTGFIYRDRDLDFWKISLDIELILKLSRLQFWYQDWYQDFQDCSLDIKIGIKTFMMAVLILRLVLRLSGLQSRCWDWYHELVYFKPFMENCIETFKTHHCPKSLVLALISKLFFLIWFCITAFFCHVSR